MPSSRPPTPDSPDPGAVVDALLGWLARSARDLPWRRSRDPYAIWVSEVMLQQTQVRTVIPYWERWMAALPDVAALASAPEEQVLRLWEGLGYYSRARNLQRAARQVIERHAGRFPADAAALRELAGVGPYTAGAVASIAFDLPEPIVDGNVIRVLARVHAVAGDPRSVAVRGRIWALAREAVEGASVRGRRDAVTPLALGPCSQLNQALMELGALVCTPSAPDCAACPVAPRCRARALGRVGDFPGGTARPATTARRLATVAILLDGRLMVRQRPSGEINAGFWEFPGLEIGPDDDPAAVLCRWLEVPPGRMEFLARVRHSITRYRFTQEVHVLRAGRIPQVGGGAIRWVTPEELAALPLTAAHRRVARRLPTGC